MVQLFTACKSVRYPNLNLLLPYSYKLSKDLGWFVSNGVGEQEECTYEPFSILTYEVMKLNAFNL